METIAENYFRPKNNVHRHLLESYQTTRIRMKHLSKIIYFKNI